MVSAKRKAIESLYIGKCIITEYKEVRNEVTKITKHREVSVVTDQPCKLSFERISSVNQSDGAKAVTQAVKLFIAPEIVIKPGSKITVTQNGVTTDYQNSGEPARYSSHQEIMLELFKGWA
ncbi:hypothetical protein [Paenibacillus lentus]|uniref:Phage protein n=1 Tax=Paenibacillus lentus TaxID=1338368 RepID=A0A3Q8S393_9BACL|nr:hypothetical protein [Paenibacillus lentus]AZK44778.1 hypothetical protein EIM92_00020 [Paenibacillus lentus]